MTKPSQAAPKAAQKLCNKSLEAWRKASPAPEFALPDYPREGGAERIVHIGVGGFHRAHMAVYCDMLMRLHGVRDAGICGVGLLPGDAHMRDALGAQDGLYTVVERSAEGQKARIIGSLTSYLHAPSNPEAVVAKMADAETDIVSMTITENGYYSNEGTGELDETHPEIKHDLSHPDAPKTVYGYLVLALRRRFEAGIAPFTLMSCDNMQQNGHILRRMLLAFTRRLDPTLADWLAEKGAFPNSMVDRITPRTTDSDREMVAQRFGIEDAWPVVTEPFLQWVIEDKFSAGRPPWEKVGAQFVPDVEPYEMMKLRLLNASHSALGYAGYLCGFQFIHEVMTDPQFNRYIKRMMAEEVRPRLPAVPGIDLDEYCATLIERFSNPTIADQVTRICMQGSGKMPKYILPPLMDQLAKGGQIKLLTLCVAAWFRYLDGRDEKGRDFTIEDPMAELLQKKAREGRDDPRALLAVPGLFSEDLTHSPAFLQELTQALQRFYRDGARATLAHYLE